MRNIVGKGQEGANCDSGALKVVRPSTRARFSKAANKSHNSGSAAGSVGPARGELGTGKPGQVWQVLAKRLLFAKHWAHPGSRTASPCIYGACTPLGRCDRRREGGHATPRHSRGHWGGRGVCRRPLQETMTFEPAAQKSGKGTGSV